MTRLTILFASAMLAVAGPATAQVTVTCRSPGVTDGDTIRCGGERVRIWGLDAPERDTPVGPAATRALAGLTRGQVVTCTQHQASRSHGRLVARCVLPDGRDLACEMIRSGAAQEWVRFSRGAYRGCR